MSKPDPHTWRSDVITVPPGPDLAAYLADQTAISELTAAYNWALDEGRSKEWVDTFTDDGALEIVGGATVRGRNALEAFMRSRTRNLFHVTTNAIIRIDKGIGEDEDTAVQELSLLVFAIADDRSAMTIQSSGRYTDSLVRWHREGRFGWRFAWRRLMLHIMPDVKVADAAPSAAIV
jgi:SnoaL-like domain